MTSTILHGDALTRLRELPERSVQTVVTSPPYWGLRDYGVAGQIGSEDSPAAWVAVMVEVFAEVRRVLRDDGTVWVNLGDCYVSGQGGRQSSVGELPPTIRRDRPDPKPRPELENAPAGWAERAVSPRTYPGRKTGLKPKDLIGLPWRLALALQDDGWYIRKKIVWAKKNPMPESCNDRPTSSHEDVFLLSKRARYFYDAEAVREESSTVRVAVPTGWDTGPGLHSTTAHNAGGRGNGARVDKQRGHSRRHDGFNDRWDAMERAEQCSSGRNLRDVWWIATQANRWQCCSACMAVYSGTEFDRLPKVAFVDERGKAGAKCRCDCGETDRWAGHFAAFPEDLVVPCVKAGTSERGACPACGAPWKRIVEKTFVKEANRLATRKAKQGDMADVNSAEAMGHNETRTVGWRPTCKCVEAATVPQVVLDPFAGSGTTGVVAKRLGRDFIGVELREEYARMAERRIADEPEPEVGEFGEKRRRGGRPRADAPLFDRRAEG